MPYSHSIDTARAVVFATAQGRLGDEDLIRLAHEISGDPLFLPGMRLLCDWGGVTLCEVTRVGIAYELANVTAAAPMIDALSSRIAKMVPAP